MASEIIPGVTAWVPSFSVGHPAPQSGGPAYSVIAGMDGHGGRLVHTKQPAQTQPTFDAIAAVDIQISEIPTGDTPKQPPQTGGPAFDVIEGEDVKENTILHVAQPQQTDPAYATTIAVDKAEGGTPPADEPQPHAPAAEQARAEQQAVDAGERG